MQMCCRHRDSRARSWDPGCWRCHLCLPPGSKDSHRTPSGPCFSADSAPAGLWGHWSNWSLGRCVFGWGPEAETASLHLPHHSPSSHLLRGNVCHRRGGRHRGSGEFLAARLPPGELSGGDASSTLSCSSSARPQELRCDPCHLPESRSSPAPQHPTPSAGGVWHLLVQTPANPEPRLR